MTLIKNNTLPEDQVKQIIEQSVVSYNRNWENGTLLTSVGDTSLLVSKADMTINSIFICIISILICILLAKTGLWIINSMTVFVRI